MLRLILPLATFVGGSALQLQQSSLYMGWIYGCLCLPALLLSVYSAIKLEALPVQRVVQISQFNRTAGLLILGCSAGALGFGQAGWQATAYQSQAMASELEGHDIRVTGVIAAMPQRDESGLRFRMNVESAQIERAGKTGFVQLPPRIQLSWYRNLPRLSEDAALTPYAELQAGGSVQAGERWQLLVRLKAPHGNLNPYGFDYELWLWEQGIAATGYVRATTREAARGDAPRKIGDTQQYPLEAARQKLRDAIFERVENPAQAGVIAALAAGDQAAIDRADWDVYRATGVAHLMSISGLHITMFAWGMALLISSLWRRSIWLTNRMPAQHAALLGGFFLALLYALFSGWGLPAQRTVGMLALVTLLKLSGKRWPWPLVWLSMLALIVACDPWALLSAGFWLSFVAVGVLFATEMGQERMQGEVVTLRTRVLRMLREQWVMTLALAPLSLLLFNQVSIVGLVANALAIPWVTLVITPLALAGAVLPPLWGAAAWGIQLLGDFLGWMAGFPFATISIASSTPYISALAIFGAILMVMRLPLPVRFAGLAMLLPMLLISPPRPASGEFTVLAADIGQGNALLIQTENHSLLYDTGPRFSRESDAGQRTLVPLLRALGEKLDVVMVSHRDADHIGGAAAVLKMQPQARLVSSIEAEHELQSVRPSERCVAGQMWQWDGVNFDILHPSAEDYETPQKSNAMSCVLRISNGKQTALLTGDLEAAQEQRLIAQGVNMSANVMLVPHHGSKTSSIPPFLDAINPQIAFVQAGYRNRFQHPVPEVMQRYIERNIRTVQSDRCGAAMWRSDVADEVSCQREIAKRYWHHRF